MLTGQVPFDGESVGEILMKHLTTPPDLTRVPAEFRRTLERALLKDPGLRYASMAEMTRDLAISGGTAVPVAKALPPVARVPCHPAKVAGAPVVPEQLPMVLPVTVTPRVWLGELAGSMSMSAVLALLLCIVWAAMLRSNHVSKPFLYLLRPGFS